MYCKGTMMPYMTFVMIEVVWKSNISKVSNIQMIWGETMISMLQRWCANLWINNLLQEKI